MELTERLKVAMDSQYIQENTDEIIELLCDAVAEIERLKKFCELAVKEREMQNKSYFYTVDQLNEANAEIERLNRINDSLEAANADIYADEKRIKTEAVKEFAQFFVDHSDGGIFGGNIPDLYVEFMGGEDDGE